MPGMFNRHSTNRRVAPREVCDPDETAWVTDRVRASVRAQLPGPARPTGRAYNELALYADLELERVLDNSPLAVAEEPGEIAGRFGAAAGVVYVTSRLARLPERTDDRFAGVLRSDWRHLWQPPRRYAAPAFALAELPVPATLAELHDQFVANVAPLGTSTVIATGDVVVPPLYGTRALTVQVPHGVRVRALAGCAGHNRFVAVPATSTPLPRQLAAA